MKTFIKILFLVLIVIYFSGCATGYHPDSFTGGYYDNPAGGTNRYLVGFSGNKYTSRNIETKYAHQRALELCNGKSFNGYKVLSQYSDSSKIMIECENN